MVDQSSIGREGIASPGRATLPAMRLPTAMAASLLILALSAGCEQGPNDDAPPPVVAPSTQPAAPPAPEAPETPEPEAPPSPDIDENLACARHDECRLLEGVCGSPAPSSSTGADATRREIEARARITTCGVAGIGVDDATPACIEGACSVLLGPPADRRCA